MNTKYLRSNSFNTKTSQNFKSRSRYATGWQRYLLKFMREINFNKYCICNPNDYSHLNEKVNFR